MVRSHVAAAEGGYDDLMDLADGSDPAEMEPITGRVKWFDATRGFGFLVSEQLDGDILLHFSVLREHGRRSVPEGALIECVPMRLERGSRRSECCRSTHPWPCPSRRGRPCLRANARTARLLRTTPVRSSRWRSNGSTAFGAMVSSSGRTNWAARTCSCTWKRCACRTCRSCSPDSSWRRASRRAARD